MAYNAFDQVCPGCEKVWDENDNQPLSQDCGCTYCKTCIGKNTAKTCLKCMRVWKKSPDTFQVDMHTLAKSRDNTAQNLDICDDSPNKVALLLGRCRSGKSSIFNRLTGATNKATDQMESETRHCSQKQVIVGSVKNFFLLDTPGYASGQDAITHSLNHKAALTHGPLSGIFVMIEYQHSLDSMWTDFLPIYKQTTKKGVDHLLVVIVSKWDLCTKEYYGPEREKRRAQIQDKFERMAKVKHFIWSEKSTDAAQVAKDLYKIATVQPPVQISYTEAEIITRFKFSDEKDFAMDLGFESTMEQYETQSKDFLDMVDANQKIPDLTPAELMDLQYFLMPWARAVLEKLLKEYEDEHGERMDTLGNYQYWITLREKVDTILATLKRKIYASLGADHQKDAKFRKCSNCPEVWVRVEGCDNVRCGSRPTMVTDIVSTNAEFDVGSIAKWVIKFVKGFGYKATKNPARAQVQAKAADMAGKMTPYAAAAAANNEKPVGCGHAMKWNEMTPVTVDFLNIVEVTSEIVKNEFKISAFEKQTKDVKTEILILENVQEEEKVAEAEVDRKTFLEQMSGPAILDLFKKSPVVSLLDMETLEEQIKDEEFEGEDLAELNDRKLSKKPFAIKNKEDREKLLHHIWSRS